MRTVHGQYRRRTKTPKEEEEEEAAAAAEAEAEAADNEGNRDGIHQYFYNFSIFFLSIF
jgi:hypothetical protein